MILWGFFFQMIYIMYFVFVCLFKPVSFITLCFWWSLSCTNLCAVHSLVYMRNNCADLEKLKTFTHFGNINEQHFKVLKNYGQQIRIWKQFLCRTGRSARVFCFFVFNWDSILFMHKRHEHKCDVVSNLHLKQNKTPGHPTVA